jgi:hypothetical protein
MRVRCAWSALQWTPCRAVLAWRAPPLAFSGASAAASANARPLGSAAEPARPATPARGRAHDLDEVAAVRQRCRGAAELIPVAARHSRLEIGESLWVVLAAFDVALRGSVSTDLPEDNGVAARRSEAAGAGVDPPRRPARLLRSPCRRALVPPTAPPCRRAPSARRRGRSESSGSRKPLSARREVEPAAVAALCRQRVGRVLPAAERALDALRPHLPRSVAPREP